MDVRSHPLYRVVLHVIYHGVLPPDVESPSLLDDGTDTARGMLDMIEAVLLGGQAADLVVSDLEQKHEVVMQDLEARLKALTHEPTVLRKRRAEEENLPARIQPRSGHSLPDAARESLMQWLLSNMGHPYPSASQKQNLVRETGLTLAQVDQWFINARRRYIPKQKK